MPAGPCEQAADHQRQGGRGRDRRRAARRRGRCAWRGAGRRRGSCPSRRRYRGARGHARIDRVHDHRDDEVQAQVHRHDDHDDLERLAVLVDRRVGDRDQVGIADHDRERRVLDQVHVLARERRDREAQRLRKDRPGHRLAARHAECERRHATGPRDRLHAGADQLGDRGRREEREAEPEREEFRLSATRRR
jgi:hypothetical protein